LAASDHANEEFGTIVNRRDLGYLSALSAARISSFAGHMWLFSA